MAKNGQAKVLSNDELAAVLNEIEHHRYPAKNALIIQISFELELRAQKVALLRSREIAALSDESVRGYKIKDVLMLPKSVTTGARAMLPSATKPMSEPAYAFPWPSLVRDQSGQPWLQPCVICASLSRNALARDPSVSAA